MKPEVNKNTSEKKFLSILSLLFRKYPSFRVLSVVLLIFIILSCISLATVKIKKIPNISSVTPLVGHAGDTMTIRGSNFGSVRGTNYVEIGGSKITASGYVSWSDNLIKITIPSNVQDGLVIVSTLAGKSKPEFFANEAGIPVAVQQTTKSLGASITSITPSSGAYGTLITIIGSDFGTTRAGSKVVFTANQDDSYAAMGSGQGELTSDFDFTVIPAGDSDYDYEYWSDSEIRVRIPDGAATGPVYVKNGKGKSNLVTEEINPKAGKKSYLGRKTYILQINADIDSVDTKNETTLTLRVPRPFVTSWQPMVELTECNSEPVIADYKNTVIHQLELQKSSFKDEKIRFSHNFVVSTYAVQTQINADEVKAYSQSTKEREMFQNATVSDVLVPCDNEELFNFANAMTTKDGKLETNPYKQAKLIYEYILDTYRLRDNLRKSDASPMDLLKSNKGDPYDFSIFYTALLRSLGIPAQPIAGILVDAEMKSKAHWWVEFYLEDLGWIPVDISLAMKMPYKAFRNIENPAEYYFGNLDSQHIVFSKGWNEIKQTITPDSKIVYRPKTYAFQSIWEETNEGNVNYSSLWNDPIVLGLY